MKLRTTLLYCAIALALTAPFTAGAAISPMTKLPNHAMAKPVEAQPADSVAITLPALSADQIVEKNVAARGGLDAWRRVQSMSLTGKLDAGRRRADGGQFAKAQNPKVARAEAKAAALKVAMGKSDAQADNIIQLPYQMELKRPLKSRLEVEFKGDKAVQVYDGENGWKLRPYLGRREVERFSPEEMKAASAQQPLDGPLIDYRAKGTSIEVLGGELVEGRGAYKLKLTLKSGEVRHVWVDAQSFLDVKIDGAPRRVDGKPRAVATYIRDYKRVDGLLVPHLLETHVDGMRDSSRILVERVALNVALDDGRFDKPE
jgi:hypothetical protein